MIQALVLCRQFRSLLQRKHQGLELCWLASIQFESLLRQAFLIGILLLPLLLDFMVQLMTVTL